ncbi:LytTR family transcriptional regulator [Paenibacillus sepulcri]|uniref:HTH LytTR-type domain-containing protein n=1 Tax=Paenibacillus sepulcri TaxID=359917 RepID=A0ABS7C6H4_9BACL|nr:hypothetical protein [Paenibacillus sepulcri]
MHVPVKDVYGNLRFIHISRDTVFLQTDPGGNLLFHGNQEVYRSIRSVEEWASLLSRAGFLRVDRGTIVNLNKGWLFDPKLRVLKPQSMKDDSILIPVAGKLIPELKQVLGGEPWA